MNSLSRQLNPQKLLLAFVPSAISLFRCGCRAVWLWILSWVAGRDLIRTSILLPSQLIGLSSKRLFESGGSPSHRMVRGRPSGDLTATGRRMLRLYLFEPAPNNSGVLVIPENDVAGGRPGRYPFLPGYLDPERTRELDGVRFRVCSPEGEWFNRASPDSTVPGRQVEPKIEHDRELLAAMIPEKRRTELLESGRAG